MSQFINSLNFSSTKPNTSAAIEIKKWHGVCHYGTLCRYCSEYDIDLSKVSDKEFLEASEIMTDFGQEDKSTDSYFFWID